MSAQIRDLALNEAELVATLDSQLFGSEAWPVDVIAACIEHPNFRVLAADFNGFAVAGYSCLIKVGDQCEVGTVGVLRPHRRHGIGASLMHEMLRIANAWGTRQIWLNVRTGNVVAYNMYDSFGFSISETIGDYYEDGESSFRMVLELDSDRPPVGQ